MIAIVVAARFIQPIATADGALFSLSFSRFEPV